MNCKICNKNSKAFSTATLLCRHKVRYYLCPNCLYIQTEYPYWLEEAYSDAIAETDVGLVGRNIGFSRIAMTVVAAFFDPKGIFLDYGGGYGLLVRLMRDHGFNFYRFDPQCPNLFAGMWDTTLDHNKPFELITAFEVFEHLIDPVAEIEKMLKHTGNILFSTQLIPSPIPKPGQWWFYALETGQHVSFFSFKTLQILAAKYQLNLYSDSQQLHMLSSKRVSHAVFRFLTRYKVALLFSCLVRRKSLLETDYLSLVERRQSKLKIK